MQHFEDEPKAFVNVEKKRKEIAAHAAEQYEKGGSLASSVLLAESNELDGILNKQLLENRIAQRKHSETDQFSEDKTQQ